MIEPTVGRIVWYHEGDKVFAAIVAKVWSDTCINIGVFNENGETFNRTSVSLHQDGDERPQSNYAEWMPYQKGQATKTEQLEKQIAEISETK